MRKKYLLLLVLIGWLNASMQAQIPEAPKSLPSPNVASLGLYGGIPVSLFTGTPNISIPLYELKVEDFTLPISLGYHAGGINPDQHPGWNGLGWSLNAGGVIHRSVKDGPDESSIMQSGFYGTYKDLATSNWNTLDNLRSTAQDPNKSLIRDTEPDEFSFSFFGYQGKFLLNHEKKWCVQCDRPIKVEFNDDFLDLPKKLSGKIYENYKGKPTFKSFTLITEDGIRFTFGGSEESIEYSIDFFAQSLKEWVPTSWHLTKITLTDGTSIAYTYEHREFVNQMYFSFIPSMTVYAEDGGLFDKECSSFSSTNDLRRGYQGQLIYPSYLRKISFPEGEINFIIQATTELKYDNKLYEFQYNEWYQHGRRDYFLEYLVEQKHTVVIDLQDYLKQLKWYKLVRMEVSNKKMEIIRDFSFSYNNNRNQRLMLESVKETDGRCYRMHYNHPENLPSYLSLMVDHWGFYNATPLNGSLTNYYAKREPNPNAALFGILEKVEYPTGGYTRLVFEPHTYRKQVKEARWEGIDELDSDKIAGGVRIKQIINSDSGNAADEVISKNYFYTSNCTPGQTGISKSSGVLGQLFRYSFLYKVESFTHNQKIVTDIFNTQSVLPGCDNEHYIGYTDVIEKTADGSYKHYQFTNHDNGHLDTSADAVIQLCYTAYQPCVSRAMERGKIILLESYSADGKLASKTETQYVKTPSPDNYVRTLNARYVNPCGYTFYDEGTAYKVYLYNYVPGNITESTYDNPEHPIVNTTTLTYDEYGQMASQKKSITAGTQCTFIKRPYSFLKGEYKDLIDRHILSPIIEQTEKVTLSKEKTVYQKFADYRLDEGILFLNSLREKYTSDEWKNTYLCHKSYKGLPIHVTENGVDVVYFWDLTNRRLVAEIRNASLEEVESVIGEKDLMYFQIDQQTLHALRVLLPEALVNSFTYKSLVGITSIIDQQGLHSYYEYDWYGRLKIVRDDEGKIEKVYDYQYSITD